VARVRSREDEPTVVMVARVSARANRAALRLTPIASVSVTARSRTSTRVSQI